MTKGHATEKKEHPPDMRSPDADIARIDRATAMRARSRTDFVREATVLANERDCARASRQLRTHSAAYIQSVA